MDRHTVGLWCSLRSKRSRTSELKCFVSRASKDSSRAKIGARAKKGTLPAPFPFLLSPQFSRDQNLSGTLRRLAMVCLVQQVSVNA